MQVLIADDHEIIRRGGPLDPGIKEGFQDLW
jgi:hypothetical protein